MCIVLPTIESLEIVVQTVRDGVGEELMNRNMHTYVAKVGFRIVVKAERNQSGDSRLH